MSDTISQYRQVRMILNLPAGETGRTYWSLHFVGVKRGIPSSQIMLDGFTGALTSRPTVEEVLEAIGAAVRSAML